jgi:Flp pilus assembly protein TadG
VGGLLHRLGIARKRRDQKGVYTVLLALMLPALIGSVGLAVDVSHFWLVHGQLQNTADAAVLAGAKDINGTSNGRVSATASAGTFAAQNKVDGVLVDADEVVKNVTGKWDFATRTFTKTQVGDLSANAIRVVVQRADVDSYFSRILNPDPTTRTLTAFATAVAGGARSVPCAAPFTIASCILKYDGGNSLICPTSLSFQNGMNSVGLTHPDGTDPVNGANTEPYIKEAVTKPLTCNRPSDADNTVPQQNGSDLSATSVNDINTATKNGVNPVQIVIPVVDESCGSSGPTYNSKASVVGYLKMKIVGARGTGAAPAKVSAACPGIGKKNICITSDCSTIVGTVGGGTIQPAKEKVFLVQ